MIHSTIQSISSELSAFFLVVVNHLKCVINSQINPWKIKGASGEVHCFEFFYFKVVTK